MQVSLSGRMKMFYFEYFKIQQCYFVGSIFGFKNLLNLELEDLKKNCVFKAECVMRDVFQRR